MGWNKHTMMGVDTAQCFVLTGPSDRKERTDHPAEAYLIIEVADSSLALDRGKKLRLYASCAVPEYWIVNIAERQVEVRTAPKNGLYETVAIAQPGDVLRVPSLGGAEIAVSEFLR